MRVSVLQNGGGAVSVDSSGGVMRFVNCTFQNSAAVRLHAAHAFCGTGLVKEEMIPSAGTVSCLPRL